MKDIAVDRPLSARSVRRVGFLMVKGNGGSRLSPRSSLLTIGDLTRPPSLVGVVVATLLFAACSGGSSPTTSIETPDQNSTSSTTQTTDPPTTSSTTSPPPEPTSSTLPEDELTATWTSYWQAWTDVRASEDLDAGPLQAVASADVVEGAIALFERQRSSGQGPVETDVELHPVIEAADSDRATVEDCVLLTPSFTETVGVWHEADFVRTDEGWIVDDIRIRTAGGCVPKEMADAAITAYEAFYAAWPEFWDPADPGSPLLDDLLTEPQLSVMVGLLAEHQERGAALRGQPTLHPEVVEVRSPTELVILNCLEPDPEYGLYDADSGERLDDVPPVRSGQTNVESAVMVFEGGRWKVSDLQGQVDFACEFAPTDRGLPPV